MDSAKLKFSPRFPYTNHLGQLEKAGSQTLFSPMPSLSVKFLWLMGDFWVLFWLFWSIVGLSLILPLDLADRTEELILGCQLYQSEKSDLKRLLGLVGYLSQTMTFESSRAFLLFCAGTVFMANKQGLSFQ